MERNRKFAVSTAGLATMVKSHYGIQPDAKLVEVDYDKKTMTMYFTFSHQAFMLTQEPEPEGEVPKKKKK